MTERKILFRGFHPDENGNTTITFNGQKIRGDWIYWDKFSNVLYDEDITSFSSYDLDTDIIHETVGQWVTTDKNGKDVFDGDNVLCAFEDGVFEVQYDEQTLMWVIGNGVVLIDFDHCYNSDIELIGNKWESEVTE